MGAGPSAKVAKSAAVFSKDEYVKYESGKNWYMNKDDLQPIRFASKGFGAREEDGGAPSVTIVQALKLAAEKHGDKPALKTESPIPALDGKVAPPSAPLSEWKTWTYKQYYEESRNIGKACLKVGAVRYDGAAILGFNSPEWFMSELGAMCFGGKAAGIYPTDTPDQIQYKAFLSDSSIAFVDSKSNYEKFASVVDKLPYLRAIVAWGPDEIADVTRTDGSVVKGYSWANFVKLGAEEGDDAALDKLIEDTKPGNCAALVFTSGTTGMPKAVMVSHDNLSFESYTVLKAGVPHYGQDGDQERILSYLPLSHVAGMMVDIISPIMCTAYNKSYVTACFARNYDLKAGSLGARLKAVKPTMFLGVPRVWEKIAEKLQMVGAQTTGLKKKLSGWAKGLSLEHQKVCQVGSSGSKGWGFGVANILLGKIKEALGLDECKFFFTGAAPMSRDTLEYFGSIGINVNEVYGMSECSGATTWSTDACHLWGSIGYEMHGTEVCIFDVKEDGSKSKCPTHEDPYAPPESAQGEVCFRGRHIMMGYLSNPKLGPEHVAEMKKKNEETIDSEGWLHSGDKGSKDKYGMFHITGRYKELIITAGGENVSPVPIEDTLKKNCPAISNAMMVGDKRKFNIVLLTLKCVGATGELPGSNELTGPAEQYGKTIEEACSNKKMIEDITNAIKKTNSDGTCCPSNASKIQKFSILPTDFSVEGGEITPSLKLKRSVATKKYIEIVDAIYESKETFVPFTTVGSY